MRRSLIALAALAAGLVASAVGFLYARRHPSACPYAHRWMVQLPKPGVSVKRMLDVLDPQPKERLLEIGPGTGYYSLPVAQKLTKGRLEVFDLQQDFLDLVSKRASKRGIENVAYWLGDAQDLIFEDNRFDGAYLVTVLGEIPDQDAALRELARVVKPGGRVVFGEVALDPHIVTLTTLKERAAAAGLRFERKAGTPAGYVARFAVAGD
jgi:ubiquinone/menaquinone biosynthesis C-methylase UbiE